MKLPKIKLPVRDLAGQAGAVLVGLVAAWAQAKIVRAADRVVGKIVKR